MNYDYYTISSKNPKYVFSPEWKVHFLDYQIKNTSLLLEIKKYLLEQEQVILKKYPPNISPGVNSSSTITSRYMEYNLFTHSKGIECIEYLKKIILDNFQNILFHSGEKNYDPYISCWYTITRPGEIIPPHRHDNYEMSFLSGNLIISCEDSHTVYELPYQQDLHSIKNKDGNLTLFESHLVHWTTPHNGKNPRISIAFDFKENLDGCPVEYLHRFCKINK